MASMAELDYALDRAEALATEQAQEVGRLRALCERYREQVAHAEKVVSEARENEQRNSCLHQVITEENERLEAALEDAQAKVEELKQAARLKVALEVQEQARVTISHPLQFGPTHTGDCDCFSDPIQFDPTPKGYPDLYA